MFNLRNKCLILINFSSLLVLKNQGKSQSQIEIKTLERWRVKLRFMEASCDLSSSRWMHRSFIRTYSFNIDAPGLDLSLLKKKKTFLLSWFMRMKDLANLRFIHTSRCIHLRSSWLPLYLFICFHNSCIRIATIYVHENEHCKIMLWIMKFKKFYVLLILAWWSYGIGLLTLFP